MPLLKHRGVWGPSHLNIFMLWENLFHILSMTGINYCDGITINAVCKVPFVCIGHVVAKPACQFRFTSWQSALNLIDRIDSVSYIALQIVLIISMPVFLCHILIESKYFTRCTRLNDIIHISQQRKYGLSPRQ